MRLALCDDEPTALQTLEYFVHTFGAQRGLDIETDCFSCGEDFLLSPEKYEIVLMDIYMDGINGIEAVRKYRLVYQSQIIFTTVSQEYAVEAFRLNAAHYLVKPLTQKDVNEALERCLFRLGKRLPDILRVKTCQGILPVPMEKIVYIEIFNKLAVIHTLKRTYQTYASLDALFQLLNKGSFMRAQRSYIVNMNYIKALYFDRIVLQGGTEIILSRSKRTELKEQYREFLLDLAKKGDF